MPVRQWMIAKGNLLRRLVEISQARPADNEAATTLCMCWSST